MKAKKYITKKIHFNLEGEIEYLLGYQSGEYLLWDKSTQEIYFNLNVPLFKLDKRKVIKTSNYRMKEEEKQLNKLKWLCRLNGFIWGFFLSSLITIFLIK